MPHSLPWQIPHFFKKKKKKMRWKLTTAALLQLEDEKHKREFKKDESKRFNKRAGGDLLLWLHV